MLHENEKPLSQARRKMEIPGTLFFFKISGFLDFWVFGNRFLDFSFSKKTEVLKCDHENLKNQEIISRMSLFFSLVVLLLLLSWLHDPGAGFSPPSGIWLEKFISPWDFCSILA